MPIRELLVADANEAALPPAVKGGLAVAVVLVVAIAGIMSGLTLGLVRYNIATCYDSFSIFVGEAE